MSNAAFVSNLTSRGPIKINAVLTFKYFCAQKTLSVDASEQCRTSSLVACDHHGVSLVAFCVVGGDNLTDQQNAWYLREALCMHSSFARRCQLLLSFRGFQLEVEGGVTPVVPICRT